jgi:EAL domain-containing protein (putative c-di-GMP-specific phosphodiesterase class I)
MLGQVTKANRYAFDQSCRVKAISLAAQLGLSDTGAQLLINFMPGALYNPAACIQLTLATVRELGFPCDRIIFEITEAEVVDRTHIRGIVKDYRQRGFKIALMTSVRATPASTCWPTSQPISSSSIWI